MADDGETTFEEKVVLDAKSMRAATRLHGGKVYIIRRVILVLGGALILLIGAFLAWRTLAAGRPSIALGLLLCVGGYSLVKGSAFDWFLERRSKKWMQPGELNREVCYVIEPEWIGFRSEDVESRIRYKAIFKWKSDDTTLLLYRTARLYQVVPCHQFSHEANAALRARLNKFQG